VFPHATTIRVLAWTVIFDASMLPPTSYRQVMVAQRRSAG
jgi:hypothetical protein